LAGASALAQAQVSPFARGFDSVPIKATAAMDSGLGLEGARLTAVRSYNFAALFDFNLDTLALKLGQEKLGNLIPFRADLRLLAAYQIHPRVELAADLPFTVYQTDNFKLLRDNGFNETGVAPAGLGDLRLLPRVAILSQDDFPIGLAGVAEVRLPTGDGNSFLGDVGVVFAPRLAIERSFADGHIRVLGNLGYRLRPYPGRYLNLYVGNEFAMGAGVILGMPDFIVPKVVTLTNVQLLGEMHLATPTERPFTFDQADSLKTPWELQVGARAKVWGHWNAMLTIGRGLGTETGYGREAFRVLFGVAYEYRYSDRDGDGVPDEDDKCPEVPGPKDHQGCPKPINPDRDDDGVPDAVDECPDIPGLAVFDGCPDRDGDGIPDIVDKCPDEPGPAENLGCPIVEQPQVVLESGRIRVRGEIMFETDQAVIQPQSFKMLDDVFKVLADNPEVGPVHIEGHTDNRGPRAYNQALSERRAKAVFDYLVKKGIDKKRLKSAGFGLDKPIADNNSAIGRAKNRRTEFRLVKESDKANVETPGAAPGTLDMTVPAPTPGAARPQPAPAAAANSGAVAPSAAADAGTGPAKPATPKPAADAGTAPAKPATPKPATDGGTAAAKPTTPKPAADGGTAAVKPATPKPATDGGTR
jgi:outer membrane protein OmpA-like peptidoglycan-associated protein